jgi:hypothetical protein
MTTLDTAKQAAARTAVDDHINSVGSMSGNTKFLLSFNLFRTFVLSVLVLAQQSHRFSIGLVFILKKKKSKTFVRFNSSGNGQKGQPRYHMRTDFLPSSYSVSKSC